MAEVVVTDLQKTFGEVVAVNHIGFDVKEHEFVVLLGPSGCGKTTTLRMIAGLETPDSGSIEIGGVDVTFMAPRNRNIAMVFERYALYPHLSVYENISYPLHVRKLSEDEIAKRVGYVTDTLRIGELLDRRVSQLSGGQMQRVAIGRAIVRDAAVFLLDEPISHLDAKLRSHMRAELKRLQREIQSTTIMVSHDQLEAMSMADRIAVMNFGVIQQFARPGEIFNLPANKFVANFVGEPSMNFLDCEIRREGGAAVLRGNGFTVPVDAARLSRLESSEMSDGKFSLGIRPEHLRLHPHGDHVSTNLVDARVYIVEPLGTEVIYDMEIGDKVIRVKVLSDQAKLLGLKMGDIAHIEFRSDSIYLFDGRSEKTIMQAEFAEREWVAS